MSELPKPYFLIATDEYVSLLIRLETAEKDLGALRSRLLSFSRIETMHQEIVGDPAYVKSFAAHAGAHIGTAIVAHERGARTIIEAASSPGQQLLTWTVDVLLQPEYRRG